MNKSRIWTNLKFSSGLRLFHLLRNNNKPNTKNTNNPKFRTNPEFEQTQKFSCGFRSFDSLRKNYKPKLRTNPQFEQT